MSAPLLYKDVLHYQRLLASAGFYKGELDGDWGPKTDAADHLWQEEFRAIRDDPREGYGTENSRSEVHILTLLPVAQRLCRRVVALLGETMDARVISGTRTYAEQRALYMRGRYGRPGPRVTNAREGSSNHNFGIAWDIGIFDGGRYLQESPLYAQAGEIVVKAMGREIEWGGAWRGFVDRPHYQVRTGLALAEVRRRFEAGKLAL